MAENNLSRAGSLVGGPALSRYMGTVRDARQLSDEALDLLRISAVRALVSGRSQKEVAESFGVSRQAVHKWTRISREGGPAMLKSGRRGRPKTQLMEPWQEARLLSTIILVPPVMVGVSSPCWTRKAIAQLARKWFRLHLSPYSVKSYLKRWGFKSQKSVRYRFEQTPAHLLEWLGRAWRRQTPEEDVVPEDK